MLLTQVRWAHDTSYREVHAMQMHRGDQPTICVDE